LKILLSWLRDFVNAPGTAEEIARTMSVRGFAVEGIDTLPDGDAVIDFEVMANRPDCMSVVGLAREVATAYGLPLAQAATAAPPTDAADAGIDVVLDDPDLCPRYVGAVADVMMGPSPAWMQARLQATGVRPISNVVDVTNYVMLELGQPMHAFDLARLGGGRIRCRRARAGEKLKTLDGQDRDLTPDMLVIADAERPVAIGGVMGGADSEVSSATRTIVFEAASFQPLSVRRTSRTLGLKTEASIRFERGVDPHLPRTAMERALDLLAQTGAGRRRGGTVDRCRQPFGIEPRMLRLRRAKIAGLLGAAVPDPDVERIITSLGFSAVHVEDGWRISVPTRRVDVLREVDLIEEVARHYGFDQLPVTFPPLAAPAPPPDPRIMRARHLRTVLTAAGFSEAVTFGFMAEPAAVPFSGQDDLVPIANPLSENFAVLRPSVLPGLLDAVSHNRRREQRDVRLFEIGARFSKSVGEHRVVACAWTGVGGPDHWSGGAREVDFFDIKGVVERLCQALRIEARTDPHQEAWLVPGRSAALVPNGSHDGSPRGAKLGVLGQLAPSVAEAHGLPGADPLYVAEIDLDAAERMTTTAEVRVEPLPRYPSVTRDVAMLVADTLPAETVRTTIRAAAPETLVRVREFDRYQGKGIPEGKVSVALRLTFRSPDRTLTDTEVQAAMEGIIAALGQKHGAVQR
jgi:phenylalanyl-tRNA synthetase beta chain